ncbi:uncharacterized protein LOC117001819 isoform X2 [Catharus ustulatus]|uniref:uncharacterized protein LOC117001819 isoform X2 n=1 Tax=Catharus ustulatus TaxID=91951 RepID=UPI0014078322|nr:uncharacterized protein LOC117001819 isoform X2 [Catharus ustulatus]
MLRTTLLFLLLQGFIQYPQQAGDGLDEAARERMQQRTDFLNQEMTRLMEELEQNTLEHGGVAWGVLLVWQFWAVTGLLVLLLALWFGLHKIRCDPDNSGHKESSSNNSAEEQEGDNMFAKREVGNDNGNVEEDSKDRNEEGSNADVEEDDKDRNEEGNIVDEKAESNVGNEVKQGSDNAKEEANNNKKEDEVNVAGNEAKESSDDAKEEVNNEKVEEVNADGNEAKESSDDAKEEAKNSEKVEEVNVDGNEAKEVSDDANEEVNNNEKVEEVNVDGNEAKEGSDDANEEVNNNEKVEEVNVDGNEAKEGSDDVNEEVNNNEKVEEVNVDGNEAKEGSHDANEEINNNEKVEEVNVDGNEAKEGSHDANEEVNNNEKGEEVNIARNEEGKHDAKEEDDGHNVPRNPGSLLEERIQLPALDLDKGCSIITDLMDKLTDIFGQSWSNSFYPVPQQAIGVGSAFEGWSPRAQDLVYHVLVPLSPPPGHAFHLELDTAGVLQRNGYVRVELLCTCTREQLGEDMLCFLHHSDEELRRDQDPSLLDTLCTDGYLDVDKTVHWFYQFMKEAWVLSPQSRHWRLRLLPSSRSCKFQLRKDQESLMVEVILGVRQGESDIFVGSQPTEVDIPSTTWLETYGVAEVKFFRHISRQAPHDSWHCKCLQLLSRILREAGFSSYALKTVMMHLLNTIPLTQWGRKDFWRRMKDTVMYLHCSLDTKQLNHFIIGNKRLPMDISLPSDFRVAESPNLFQHIASSPDAHKKAMEEYTHLLRQLKQMLF